MTGYSVDIKETSKELTAKEKVQLKDTTDCIKIDSATESGDVIIKVAGYAVLDIHNDNSEDKQYSNYVIMTDTGERYVTGSESFWSSFMDIYRDMSESGEDWSLKIYRVPSKKREGKYFITCSVL